MRPIRELNNLVRRWIGRRNRQLAQRAAPGRGPVDHVIILDGTMSTLDRGMETNAGLTYRLLCEMAPSRQLSLKYEPGIQWTGWRAARDVVMGVGINRQICRAYGFIASRYRPGDRIFLFGFSRGAFAVRSLAGVIDQIGLVQAKHATERNIQLAYRHYRLAPGARAADVFSRRYCDKEVRIEMVGVWDTVKALGIRFPVLWRLTAPRHRFHSHALGRAIRHGYHALALDETRLAFDPVLWACPPGFQGDVEQVWFVGTHGDVGGHILDYEAARPLSNIPLVWMLDRAEALGLPLPGDWRDRFDCDATAPSVGTWRGWGKLFLLRRRRTVGRDMSERLHDSVPQETHRSFTDATPEQGRQT
ncbi:MAG: DUF2235 domain-containing protein [Brevirhabdus sp.]